MLQLPSEKVLMKGVETIKAKIVELKNEPSSEEKKKAVQDALAMLETEQISRSYKSVSKSTFYVI